MYITNYNLSRVLNVIEIEVENLDKIDINKLENVLSEKEILFLRKAKTFFNGEISIECLSFSPVYNPDDDNLLFEGHNPAYHKDDFCQRLRANYINYYIPNEIKQRGNAEVKKFKKFVKELLHDGYKLEDENTKIIIKGHFGIGDVNFLRIEKSNSGASNFTDYINNMTLSEIIKEIKKILDKINSFQNKSELHKRIYNLRYREPYIIKKLLRNKSKEEKSLGQELTLAKEHLLYALLESYKKESNFNQSEIEEEWLQKLNFVPCSTCCKEL